MGHSNSIPVIANWAISRSLPTDRPPAVRRLFQTCQPQLPEALRDLNSIAAAQGARWALELAAWGLGSLSKKEGPSWMRTPHGKWETKVPALTRQGTPNLWRGDKGKGEGGGEKLEERDQNLLQALSNARLYIPVLGRETLTEGPPQHQPLYCPPAPGPGSQLPTAAEHFRLKNYLCLPCKQDWILS